MIIKIFIKEQVAYNMKSENFQLAIKSIFFNQKSVIFFNMITFKCTTLLPMFLQYMDIFYVLKFVKKYAVWKQNFEEIIKNSGAIF